MPQKNKKQIMHDSIVNLLRYSDKPLQLKDFSKALGYSHGSVEDESLKTFLNEMIKIGILEKSNNRRYSFTKSYHESAIEGIFYINRDNAIVEVKAKNSLKIIIRRRYFNTALDGDTVSVRLLNTSNEKKIRGEVVKVIKRSTEEIIGRIEQDGDSYFLIPEDDKYYIDFLIETDKLLGASRGDKVAVKLISWEDIDYNPIAEVVEIISKAGDPTAEYQSILREFEINSEFPDSVLDEANAIPAKVSAKTIKNRMDLREKLIITIDPEDAKDFDDALSLDILSNGNFMLGVHIADVSHYVADGSRLDRNSFKRGNSTYLVDQAVPMLPERLSSEICSLQPRRTRLAFSVFMEYTKKGKQISYNIAETVIKSKKRYNYDEVLDVIEGRKKDVNSVLIGELNSLAVILRKNRLKAGGINFETTETKFILNDDKKPIKSILRKTTLSTSLVEECMLEANRTVAHYVNELSQRLKIKKTLPFLYRVHDEPVAIKIREALKTVSAIGHKPLLKLVDSRSLNNHLKLFDDEPQKFVIHQILLRSMAKAEYTKDNVGHYGLGYNEYTHFTSPIRRYPDLVVHRLIKKYLKLEAISQIEIKELNYRLDIIASHTNETEKKSTDAERASIKVASCIYANDHRGEIYEGIISGITTFGIFVMLDELNVEGFIHVRDFYDDYYKYDERNMRFVGQHKKRIFAFGAKIKTKIIGTSAEKRKIDLALI